MRAHSYRLPLLRELQRHDASHYIRLLRVVAEARWVVDERRILVEEILEVERNAHTAPHPILCRELVSDLPIDRHPIIDGISRLYQVIGVARHVVHIESGAPSIESPGRPSLEPIARRPIDQVAAIRPRRGRRQLVLEL